MLGGIRRGLVITMPGSQMWGCNICIAGLYVRWSLSRLAWLLYKCAALCKAVYGTSTTKRSLGTIQEEKGISSRVSISLRYDLSCWKPSSFIECFIWLWLHFVIYFCFKVKTSLKPGSGLIKTQDKIIRFEHVPLVTPNGDVLVKELNFEVSSVDPG